MRRRKLKVKRKLACNNKARRIRQIKKRKLDIAERRSLAFLMANLEKC